MNESRNVGINGPERYGERRRERERGCGALSL